MSGKDRKLNSRGSQGFASVRACVYVRETPTGEHKNNKMTEYNSETVGSPPDSLVAE